MRAGDFERAASLANLVLAHGRLHPLVYKARALAHQQKGRHQEALAEFTHARLLTPADPSLHHAIGVCLISLNRPLEALAAFDSAIALDANNGSFHYRKGWTLELLGESDQALSHYERAIAIDPNHPDALGSLATARATAGKIAEARELAERALRLTPNQPTAIIAMAVINLAEKDFAGAERRCRSVIDAAPMTLRGRAALYGLLADALDGQDRVAEAFDAYGLEKNDIRALNAPGHANQPRPNETIDRIASHVENSPREMWSSTSSELSSPARSHVFLLGFARSGTTLLEQVLASHSDIVALEEQDLLADAARDFLADDAGLDRLAAATGDDLDSYRNAYWQKIERLGANIDGKVLVDKFPMNTIKLPLIAKLFPNAKIIFALRDPRDVVQSCYRRHFEVNAVNFEFLSLEGAAGLYASAMRLGAACREKRLLAEHRHRYEDMVADFDTSIAAVCDFIGVEWQDTLREFHTHDLLPVRSPSAAQVHRPLYNEGVGQWRRYAEQLAPVFPVLEPWVEAFGYPRD
jgi:Flp pilus assembly protein TadD